jgi:hypothetical protein
MDYKKLFERLNEKLAQNDLELVVVCVGGFVLQYHGIRATEDIDAFYANNSQVEQLIKETGDEFSANLKGEHWLNNNVANDDANKKPPTSLCQTIGSFSHLTVQIPPLEYILGLKLIANRDRDQADVATIIKHTKSHDVFSLYDHLLEMGFEIDPSPLLAGFGEAYGDQWLEEVFLENADKIRTHFR